MARDPVLAVRNLSRTYTRGRGVLSASFSLAAGELAALVGPNGAGKTTLLEALCGEADYVGSLRIAGFDREQEAGQRRHRICLPERRSFPLFLSGAVAARLAERFWEQEGLYNRFLSEVLAWGLDPADLEEPMIALSQGTREKLALALVFSCQAPLFLLDEPEAHLDPIAREVLEDRLRGLRAKRSTVLFATHDVRLAVRLADRVLVLVNGRLRDLGIAAGYDEVRAALRGAGRGGEA